VFIVYLKNDFISEREASSLSSAFIPSFAFAAISDASLASASFFFSASAFDWANYYGVYLSACTIASSSSDSDSDSELDSSSAFYFFVSLVLSFFWAREAIFLSKADVESIGLAATTTGVA